MPGTIAQTMSGDRKRSPVIHACAMIFKLVREESAECPIHANAHRQCPTTKSQARQHKLPLTTKPNDQSTIHELPLILAAERACPARGLREVIESGDRGRRGLRSPLSSCPSRVVPLEQGPAVASPSTETREPVRLSS